MTRANHKHLEHNTAKLWLSKELLETWDTIFRPAFHQARQAEQELGLSEVAVNVDTNGGNLNISEVKESKVAGTTAKLKTMLETRAAFIHLGGERHSVPSPGLVLDSLICSPAQ